METQIVPLYGEVVVAQPEVNQADAERMLVWNEAFEKWMASLRSDNTRRAYRKAWDDFLKSCKKEPWMVGKRDCQLWMDALRTRGLSDCTQQQRIAGISSFYKFVSQDYTVITPDGREVSLYNGNPAAGKSLRPEVQPYGKAIYLSSQEARALLKAIKRNTVQGLRDYALFVTYMFTGRRNSEIRLLKWGAIEEKGGRAWYKWSGKRKKDQRTELPLPAWAAIKAYLQAVGRLETMTEESYIFTALSNRAARLPNVAGDLFDPFAQPLSMREVGRLLKVYCKRAGLDPVKVHVHTLRHTAAMLRREAGDDVEAVSEFLAHSSLSVTQIYLHRAEGKKDESWAKVETILGL
jgi:integrase/recombinase XerD